MKKELPHFEFRHEQYGHINTPFTIWADPHNFIGSKWATIKDTEKQIANYVQEESFTYNIAHLYLSLRSTARSILLKYKAQRSAPSLHFSTSTLLRKLEEKPLTQRGFKYSSDIRTLKNFHIIYEAIQILKQDEPIKVSTNK